MQRSAADQETEQAAALKRLTDLSEVLPADYLAATDKGEKLTLEETYFKVLDQPNMGKLITNLCNYLLEKQLMRKEGSKEEMN